jgi:hypothetical protein
VLARGGEQPGGAARVAGPATGREPDRRQATGKPQAARTPGQATLVPVEITLTAAQAARTPGQATLTPAQARMATASQCRASNDGTTNDGTTDGASGDG